MITWPSSLPVAPLIEGFVENTPETVIRTEMDQGPAKVRPRTSAGVRKFTMRFLMTRVQTAVFDGFYTKDLNGGALSFSFIRPRTGENLSMRLTKPPEYAARNARYFMITLETEVLP